MLLSTPQGLSDFLAHLAGQPFVAVDTEFQWERSYFAHLSLLQIASPSQSALVDCLAIDDLSPLQPLLCTPATLKVFHSASQDLAILERVMGRPLVNIYDSQIANALLGGAHQTSYAKLVGQYLGLEVDKSVQHTDWLKRPLSAQQTDYARADVVHLAEIYPRQRDQLLAAGRLEWVLEDSAWLAANPPYEATDPAAAFASVAGYGRLAPRHLHALQVLAAWRETYCRERNLRPRWLIPDRVLLAVARRGKFDRGALQEEKPWVAKRVKTVQEEIAAALAQAAERQDHDLPATDPDRLGAPSAAEKQLIAVAERFVAAKAAELGIEKMMLASRADFTALARRFHGGGAPDDGCRLTSGWRRQVAGDELLALLQAEAERPICE